MMSRWLVLLLAAACAAAVVHAFILPLAPTSRTRTIRMRMKCDEAGHERRALILGQMALLTAGGVLLSPSLAFADSTGKYSTKQTAKKRYLPRVRKGVAQFQALGKQLDKADAVKAFATFTEDNLATALSLYGSSTRIGELPDPKSRTVEKEAEDFCKEIKLLSKTTPGSADAKAIYERAKTNLIAYLAGTKLEPLGDAAYAEATTK